MSKGGLKKRICEQPLRNGTSFIMNVNHLFRVRRICLALPDTSERLSHGEPTFFVHKKVFTMFANNHHNDGHVAVLVPAPPGAPADLIQASPETFFRPPYVGGAGWVGIELKNINDEDLSFHIHMAWELIAPKRLLSSMVETKPARAQLTKSKKAKPKISQRKPTGRKA